MAQLIIHNLVDLSLGSTNYKVSCGAPKLLQKLRSGNWTCTLTKMFQLSHTIANILRNLYCATQCILGFPEWWSSRFRFSF